MSKFYQWPSQNPETSLFHHGLIRTLVEYHLTNTGDNWEKFLQRNQFFPQHNDPIIDLTQVAEESNSPQTLPQEVHIESNSMMIPIMSLDGQVDVIPVARVTRNKKGFVPKQSLEAILSRLKNQPLDYVDQQTQPMCPKVDEKPKEQGKQTRQFQDICEN
jgi:hypothetical protein